MPAGKLDQLDTSKGDILRLSSARQEDPNLVRWWLGVSDAQTPRQNIAGARPDKPNKLSYVWLSSLTLIPFQHIADKGAP